MHRKSHHNKPTIHISYDEGLIIIREFLNYASTHPIEDIQAFTRQRVPCPHWVRTEGITIPDEDLSAAANAITKQLGPNGIVRVGGEKWWQWRGPSKELKGEWIEMRSHFNERKKSDQRCNKVILYVHGGAYFFGSLETHRYMMQRHARKLKGRVFAPDYRLAPQFPFPCGLQDCLAAYLWLLKTYDSKEIVVAGDSAGGGMALSLLVIMRDQGIPLPAGGILISPWCDLTHSFPSIVEDNPGDYVPPNGFRYKPSDSWPPPNADELLKVRKLSRQDTVTAEELKQAGPTATTHSEQTAIRGYTVHEDKDITAEHAYPGMQQLPDSHSLHGEPDNIHIVLDGQTIELKDQIQMYTTNQLISHPLVSPVLQPSLGGLPPLQITVGGGEMLRDEIFYAAHKAANPTAYPPSDVYLDEFDPNRETLNKYGPTYVQLQVWDNLCHVAPMLSFTRPAKYMFRSISQFASWSLARAQQTDVNVEDENVLSPVPSSPRDRPDPSATPGRRKPTFEPGTSVGRAGDPLPAFDEYMIRQRVDKRGRMYPLDPPSSSPVLETPHAKVGAINPVLVRKWLNGKKEWDIKFAKEKLRVQTKRVQEMAHGFEDFDGECPPPSSLAARRAAPGVLPDPHAKKNYGLMVWSGWSSRHDKRTLAKEKHAHRAGRRSTRTNVDTGQAGLYSSKPSMSAPQGASDEKTTGTGGITWNTPKKEQAGELPLGRASESTNGRPVSEKGGPILLLPEVHNKKLNDENASTRALFHAAGTLSMTSDASLPQSKNRPSSVGGSVAGKSELMSDTGEDTSTVGGDRDSVAPTSVAPDGASTRAVLSAKGVVEPIGTGQNRRISTDTLSVRAALSDADALSGRGSLGQKPAVNE